MYLPFFGLNEKPFAITPDPRYLFMSERHAEALAHLLYGINEAGGFVQLTGEIGTGKTTMIRSLLAQAPKDAEIALILNPRMTAPEFLLTICEELGIGVPDAATDSLKDLVDILSHYLLRAHGAGKRIVLVVDEAQNLAPDVLEQVRLLTNLETNTRKLLQIILIGQPELRDLLDRSELRQLAQRITGRYHLNPLSRAETCAYVRHRLRVAGATTDIFTSHALRVVHQLSGGVPRVINIISDRALLGAYTQDRHRVTAAVVRRSATEVFGHRILPHWLPWASIGAAVIVLACGAAALWQLAPWSAAGAQPAVTRSPRTAPDPRMKKVAAQASSAGISAKSMVRTGPRVDDLATLLTQHADETGPDDAFGRLFALWGAHYHADGTDPCTQASAQGLDCFVQRGTLAQLRVYNRPAILTLEDAQGTSHQVVLAHLTGGDAQLEIGNVPCVVSIADLSHYWFGDFVLLWKPGTSAVKPLSLGMHGAQVRRLRRSLQRLQGQPVTQPVSDVFDAQLGQLVRRFQRRHQLAVDGVAGVQTLLVLNSLTAGADSPLLQAAHVHGS